MAASAARAGFCLLLICCVTVVPVSAHAADLQIPLGSGKPEAWLVTYGPGELYWQRFGHNAIWIRDPSRNIDHVFNAGFFDFDQPGFLRRFIEGRMLYFSAALPAADEFRQYQFENRSITARLLNLDLEQYERLLSHLVRQVDPQYREYLYDYYLDNCSTRIRDAIDVALAGSMYAEVSGQPAGQNFRDHTRRATEVSPVYYFGLELALGLPTDQPISRWQEMFLPSVVDDVVAGLNNGDKPLSGPEFEVYRSDLAPPPSQPPLIAWKFLLAGILLVIIFWLISRLAGPVMAQGSIHAYLMVITSGGLLLLYLWLFTDHRVAWPNANLLLLNPLLILGLWPRFRRLAALILVAGIVLCLLQFVLPSAQYNLDVLAFLAPLSLVASAWLWKNAPRA